MREGLAVMLVISAYVADCSLDGGRVRRSGRRGLSSRSCVGRLRTRTKRGNWTRRWTGW
jgi:hypothetical protein